MLKNITCPGITSLTLLLIVNTVFFYKYAFIYTEYPIPLTTLYVFIFISLVLAAFKLSSDSFIVKKNLYFYFSVLFVLTAFLYVLFFPRFGEIGRLPAIEDWLRRYLDGQFPYNSPHTPSAFPFIFILAYPFYLAGNAGMLAFAGPALLIFFIYKLTPEPEVRTVKIILAVICIVTVYEIVTRSELILNMMLVVSVVLYCEKYLKPDKINFSFIFAAIFTGLVLSTRSVTALLFIIYFIYRFRYNLRYLLLFGGAAVSVFIALLVPLYLWDARSFVKNGPFAVQSYLSNLPSIIIIIFFISALYGGWVIKSLKGFFFTGGSLLFAAAAVSFLHRVMITGFKEALINDGYDIAYFIFCVPLLILSLTNRNSSSDQIRPVVNELI